MRFKFLITIVFIATINLLFAEPLSPSEYSDITAIRLAEPVIIDGILDESLYQTKSFNYFIQLDPDNGEPATELTKAWVGYDDKSIYVGAYLYDRQPESITTMMGRRDSDMNSDNFHLAIDSYNDNRSGYYFIINPSGTISDGTISNDNNFDNTWDGIWSGKSKINSDGWAVEIRVPFSQLRFNSADEVIMGIGLGREVKRRNEFSLSFSVPRGEPGIVSRFGELSGIRNIELPQRIELTPYITSSGASLPSESDNPFYNGRHSDFGLGTDLKIGIGNNLTIDATINPDFGQVEVDPSVINLSAYETYYDEKRPFFIEGSSIFGFGNGGPSNRMGFNFAHPDFFYSRRVGRSPHGDVDSDGWVDSPSATKILGAAKLSGKLPGNLSVGGLTALTRREFAQIQEDSSDWEEEVEPLTSYNLIRVQKEIKNGLHGLGGITSTLTRDFDDEELHHILPSRALGAGIDGWTFFNNNRDWALAGWLGYSRIEGTKDVITDIQERYNHYFQKPDVDHVSVDSSSIRLEGWAARFLLNKEKGNWIVNSALGIISPGFEVNDMGINFRTDQINKHQVIGYQWLEPGRIFRSSSISTAYMSNHNFAGDKINEMIFLFGGFQFLNYQGIQFIGGWGPRTLDDSKLRGGPLVSSPAGYWGDVGFYTDGRKDLAFEFSVDGARGENGYWAYEIDPSVRIKLGTQLNVEFNPEFSASKSIAQYVMTIDDPAATEMFGKRYILAELNRKTFEASLRLDYTFNPRLSFQAYFQGLLGVGKYSDYKEFARPRSLEYLHYDEEDLLIQYDEVADEYSVVQTNYPQPHEIDDDFNEKSLIGSAVLRWEFRPGSILYLVWTRTSENDEHPGEFKFGRDFNDLWYSQADNVLAVKLTWWIGR